MAERSGDKPKNGTKPFVTEPEARAAYLALEGKRSARRAREVLREAGRRVPSHRQFAAWRSKHSWFRLSHEHDERVATAAGNKIARTAAAIVVTRAAQFNRLATDSLVIAIEGLANLNVEELKATDIRALTEISERAAKMYELLEGRATERPDGLTRGKMDELMGEMQKEIEERLARVTTVH